MEAIPQSDTESVIRGTVKRVTFRNSENGYAVLQLQIPDKIQHLTVVGSCTESDAKVGSNLIVRGNYADHPKFGRQLIASSITPVAPESAAGIEKYLASGLIKGIGPKTARRLVAAFGKDTLDIIHQEPDKVAALAGVGKKKAEQICQAFGEQQERREILRFLIEHNISPNLAEKIYKRYGVKSVETIKKNPYLLAREMQGVGFLTADAIAMNLGLRPDAPQRLQAGIYYALEQASTEGHCFLDEQTTADRSRALLGLADEIDLTPQLDSLIQDEYIVRSEEDLYLRHIYRAEDFAAQFIAARCKAPSPLGIDAAQIAHGLAQAAGELGIQFSVEQEQAVRYATEMPLLIITGGPGCGKTTVVRALTSVFNHSKQRILLAAPTGRAAQRLSQVCGLPACTIHRLLKFDPMRGRFLFGPGQPLEADVIIIDEASMIDIMLARDLFSAIPASCTLILVGDKDQLPSVGPGRVFSDLISVKEVKTISLSHLFRRAQTSSINEVAHQINSGITPQIPEPDGNIKADAYFIVRSSPEEAASTVEALVAEQLPKKFGLTQDEIAVLTPSNRGPLGTIELNKRLQARLNPPPANGLLPEIIEDEGGMRVGDRVCQRVNNYKIDEAGVFNGDTGRVYEVDTKNRSLIVELWDGRLIKYEGPNVHQLSLAYALTVHRSQGSEYPCVVLALSESHYTLLERQLLYTGVTRAKRLLIVVGSRRALHLATQRMSAKKRCTRLRERVQKKISFEAD